MEKGGLASALSAAGLTPASVVGWADEMRVGLRGQVRRVWGRRGVPVRQRVALTYTWRHLFLVVDGRGGRVWWAWLPGPDSDALLPVIGGLRSTELAALVWDGAPSHAEAHLAALDANPARVRRLTGYRWIVDALDHLPDRASPIAA